MKDIKLEIPSERVVQSGKQQTNQPKLEDKPKIKLKNTNNKRREEKTKFIKRDATQIEEDIDKNEFLNCKNISAKDLNYKGRNLNIKKCNKNNKKRDRINIKNNTYLIITMILFHIMIPNNYVIAYRFSNVTLTIKGPGFSDILSSNFSREYHQNITYINGIKNSTITNRYYFNEINNTVVLTWNNPINNCYEMFCDCKNITKIDLSDFDSSQVTRMSKMFFGCSKISSLNLSNLITSSVEHMSHMFYGCSKLSSLNLSNFVTSNVVHMVSMFNGCSLLSSLDLSSFRTANVIDMDSMFSGCLLLENINLKNFEEGSSLTVDNIFGNVPDNIVVCLKEGSVKLLNQIKKKNCYILNCSDVWEKIQKR